MKNIFKLCAIGVLGLAMTGCGEVISNAPLAVTAATDNRVSIAATNDVAELKERCVNQNKLDEEAGFAYKGARSFVSAGVKVVAGVLTLAGVFPATAVDGVLTLLDKKADSVTDVYVNVTSELAQTAEEKCAKVIGADNA